MGVRRWRKMTVWFRTRPGRAAPPGAERGALDLPSADRPLTLQQLARQTADEWRAAGRIQDPEDGFDDDENFWEEVERRSSAQTADGDRRRRRTWPAAERL